MPEQRLGNCEKCPLNQRPVVPGYGPKGTLAIVGEAPGESEVRRGRPFVGASGDLLRTILRALGQDPDEVYYTNAVVRHPPGNKTPGMIPIRACNQRLLDELVDVNPTKILTSGGVALSSVMGANKVLPVTKQRGIAHWVTLGDREVLHVPTIHPAAVLRDPNMFQDLLFDIEKWLRVGAPMTPPEVAYTVVETADELFDLLKGIAGASVISNDLETYGFEPFNNALISIGFGATDAHGNGQAIIVPEELVHWADVRSMLWKFYNEVEARFVFHNAAFDLQFLEAYFKKPLPERVQVGDTMLLHYLHDERPIGRYLGHSLKDIARTWYDVPDYSWNWDDFYATPKKDRDYAGLYAYQSQDCVYTARLWFDLIDAHEKEQVDDPGAFDPTRVHDLILAPGARALAEAEYHGTYIDLGFFAKMQEQLEARQAISLKALAKAVSAEFNPGSPVQVANVVDAMNAPGRHKGSSVDRDALTALIRLWGKGDKRSQTLQHIIDYRNDAKVLETYVTGLVEKVDRDNRIRPDFQLAGTATGRLSCRNPNFQNIPAYMEWKVREGFAVPPGFTFVEADYSQLELRVAAWLSQDPDLIEVFAQGKDIHAEVATAIFNKPADQITEKERYMAKRIDFGLVYGRGSSALSEGPEMDYYVDELGGERWSVEDAEKYIARFLERFPRLKDWIDEVRKETVKNGFVDSPLGRRRRFPYITKERVWHTRNQAINTPIQSVASDLCLEALIRTWRRQKEFKGHVLFTVHDSVAFEVPNDQVDLAASIIRDEFENNLSIDTTGIPFPCDVEIGPNWGTLTKVKR